MFLIDLSLAKRYICPSSGEHIKFKKKTFSYLPSDAKSPFHEENKQFLSYKAHLGYE